MLARAHDGGKNPESKSGYGDNSGAYTVWVETFVPYIVTVKTGDRADAGTDARVYVSLYADPVSLVEQRLDSASQFIDDFERGTRGHYLLLVSGSLGDITSVRIRHDNSGKKPGWFLDSVTVYDRGRGVLEFPCNRWLAKDEDDKKIDRTLRRR